MDLGKVASLILMAVFFDLIQWFDLYGENMLMLNQLLSYTYITMRM